MFSVLCVKNLRDSLRFLMFKKMSFEENSHHLLKIRTFKNILGCIFENAASST